MGKYLLTRGKKHLLQMTIDTIFMCFCEDCELNDGALRPYFMSRGLMEFVENSKNSSGFHATQVLAATAKDASSPT